MNLESAEKVHAIKLFCLLFCCRSSVLSVFADGLNATNYSLNQRKNNEKYRVLGIR